MIKKVFNRTITISILFIILLASFPIVSSSEMSIFNKHQKDSSIEVPKELSNEDPTNNGDIKFEVFGFMRFFVVVTNNRDEQITVYVNYSMHFGKLGANSTLFPFPVQAKSSTFIFWDCQPMPLYFIEITCEAAGQSYTKHGFTILGFNFFYPDE
jgi:hypothetical protein